MFIGVQEDMFSMLGERTESRKDMLFRLAVQHGSDFEGGKQRIREAVTNSVGQFSKLCRMIRNEYGIAGGFSGEEHSFVTYDGRGITIIDRTQRYDSPETGEFNKYVEWLYPWPAVTKKIIELIILDEY